MAKLSPPIPLDVGSVTVKVAATAMAASMAFPPLFNTSRPACAA